MKVFFSFIASLLIVVGLIPIILSQVTSDATTEGSQINTPGCGGLFEGESGWFASPNYPNNYAEDNMDCFYTIRVTNNNARILLKFTSFDTQKNFDFVEVYDGPTVASYRLSRTSGNVLPSPAESSLNEMLVKFSTDYWGSDYKGFNATYTSIVSDCREVLTGDSGTITSPNYPDNYNENLDCRYNIQVAEGYTIILNFSFFNTGYNTDLVEIYDGPGIYNTKLLKASGGIVPNAIQSSTNQMLVTFKSDNLGKRYSGFKASYTIY